MKLTTLQYIHIFGRPIAHAVIADDEGKQVFRGTLQACLRYADEEEIELENSQDILHRIVVTDGYAS